MATSGLVLATRFNTVAAGIEEDALGKEHVKKKRVQIGICMCPF